MIRQTVQPFKPEKQTAWLPRAGPALLGGFAIGLDLLISRIGIRRNPAAGGPPVALIGPCSIEPRRRPLAGLTGKKRCGFIIMLAKK